MNTILSIILLYYLIGIEYSYQQHKNIGIEGNVDTFKGLFIATILIPSLWIFMSAERKAKRFKSWYKNIKALRTQTYKN
jgi:uncharacterized membrane protein